VVRVGTTRATYSRHRVDGLLDLVDPTSRRPGRRHWAGVVCAGRGWSRGDVRRRVRGGGVGPKDVIASVFKTVLSWCSVALCMGAGEPSWPPRNGSRSVVMRSDAAMLCRWRAFAGLSWSSAGAWWRALS
jgi:hypothetical protein